MAEKLLEDDGERMIPTFHKGKIIYGEHMGRYISVMEAVKGRSVLDIASGSGYGSKMIAGKAERVYGIDIEKRAVDYAKKFYSANNVEYRVGSATDIPLEDNTVDCVISMETLEHIEEQDKFLNEVKRVMRPNSFVVLSTPNDKVYPPGNHFHVKEHNKNSLIKLLKKHFKNVEIYYQALAISASLVKEPRLSSDIAVADWRLYKYYASKPDESIYYVAVCSDGKPPQLTENTVLAQEYSHMEQKELTDYIKGLLERSRIHEEHISKLDNENAQLHSELDHIYNSKYWKLRVIASKIKRSL